MPNPYPICVRSLQPILESLKLTETHLGDINHHDLAIMAARYNVNGSTAHRRSVVHDGRHVRVRQGAYRAHGRQNMYGPSKYVLVYTRSTRNTLAIGIYCGWCANKINVLLKSLKALPESDKLKSNIMSGNA